MLKVSSLSSFHLKCQQHNSNNARNNTNAGIIMKSKQPESVIIILKTSTKLTLSSVNIYAYARKCRHLKLLLYIINFQKNGKKQKKTNKKIKEKRLRRTLDNRRTERVVLEYFTLHQILDRYLL